MVETEEVLKVIPGEGLGFVLCLVFLLPFGFVLPLVLEGGLRAGWESRRKIMRGGRKCLRLKDRLEEVGGVLNIN